VLAFVSYDGDYPNLCSGILTLSLNGTEIVFPHYCLHTGGVCCWNGEDEIITQGPWSIDEWPDGFPEELKEEATKLVNDNVEHGCCVGCM
jgi:hypothetical protein